MSAPLHIEKFIRQPLPLKGQRRSKRSYYFRVVASNGEIVCASESYTTARARNKTAKLLAESKIEVRG